MSSHHIALRSAVVQVLDILKGFATVLLFAEKFSLIFNTHEFLVQEFEVLASTLPEIKILPDEVLRSFTGKVRSAFSPSRLRRKCSYA